MLSEVQMGTKVTSADSLAATASASNQIAIPSPQSNSHAAITPLSHEPLVGHHHARSASVPTVPHIVHPQSNFQHIESHSQTAAVAGRMLHRPELNHSTPHSNKIPVENPSMHQLTNNYVSSMDGHFDQQSYGNHYNSAGVIHSTALNSQSNAEYNDANYYANSFYANYDDQILRPYSASSNSCSSSNSDGDSQMALHHHTLHSNSSNHQDRQSQQQHCHQIGHPTNTQVMVTTNTTDLHAPNNGGGGGGGGGSHLDASNLSPEYIDCMDQRASHHSFEVNCFGGIGNVGIHHLGDDLQSNYMPNSHGIGVNNNNNGSNSILLNGNASSGGSVLFNGNNLGGGNQNIADSIQYTSVIVDSNSYHISNDQYVH